MHPSHLASAAMAIALALAATPALAQQSVSIDLAGVQIRNATNQSRSSSPNTLAPAVRYRYEIGGMVRGRPFLSPLYFLFPNSVPLDEALESLSPGSSEALRGSVINADATHPFAISQLEFEGSTEVSGIVVDFAATISAGLDASNIAFFSVQDVVLTPTTIGYLEFTSGAVVITRIPCPANFDEGGIPGAVNSNDISAFLSAWLADVAGGTRLADYNLDGITNSNDISAFLSDWLATVATGCPQ